MAGRRRDDVDGRETGPVPADIAGQQPAARLDDLLARVMDQVVRHKEGGAWICRMCDLRACGRAAGHCPAARAAENKYGPLTPPR